MFGFFRKKQTVFVASSVSEKGLVRADNQDSVVCEVGAGLFAVADGMGGGSEGALASKWVAESLEEVAKSKVRLSLAERMELVGEMIKRANRRIRLRAAECGHKTMGTTVAIMLADPHDLSQAKICHAGDSRVYRLRGGTLQPLTRDHTVGCELGSAAQAGGYARGCGSRRNPLSHVLTRAVGTEDLLRLEWMDIGLERGDRFLLCTDGVHDVMEDDDLRAVLPGGTAAEAVARISKRVTERGAPDNFSIVCVDVVAGEKPKITDIK